MATELHQAKRPVSLLAGPYGHPLHPVLVTVPIGAWVASFVFDLASRWSGEPLVFAKGAFWLVGLGVAGALAAAMFGFLDLFAIPTGTKAFRTGLLHMTVNLVVVSCFAGSFLLRRGRLDQAGGVPTALIVLSAVALALLAVAGWLGGQLAYRYGVRVATRAPRWTGTGPVTARSTDQGGGRVPRTAWTERRRSEPAAHRRRGQQRGGRSRALAGLRSDHRRGDHQGFL